MFLKSRRKLAAVATALIAVVAVVLVAALAGDRDDERDVAAARTPTATASQDSIGTAAVLTPTASVIGPLVGPIDDGFVRRDLARDEVPDEAHGIALVDVETGEGELWKIVDTDAHVNYEVSPGHRWLLAYLAGSDSAIIIADRETGNSYRLERDVWQPAAVPTDSGLLVLRSASPDGHYRVIDLAKSPTGAGTELFLTSAEDVRTRLVVILGGGERALIDGLVVSLTSGEVLSTLWSNTDATGLSFTRLQGGGALAVVHRGEQEDRELNVYRVDSEGQLQDERTFGLRVATGFGRWISPDGRWLVGQSSLPLGTAPEADYWPLVVLTDLERGETILRVVRAAIPHRQERQPWLSDSSGVLLQTSLGAAVLRPSGEIDPLPLSAIPVLSPAEPGVLISDGHLFAMDGTELSVRWGAAAWPFLHEVGLDDSGRELRFVKDQITLGRDYTTYIWNQAELPARIEKPPFPDIAQVRVEANGDTVSLRATAGATADIVSDLPAGAVVTVTDLRPEQGSRGRSAVPDPDEIEAGTRFYEASWWIHVRTEAGFEGWVRSDFLEWAH